MSFIGDIWLLWRATRNGYQLPPFERPAGYPDPLPPGNPAEVIPLPPAARNRPRVSGPPRSQSRGSNATELRRNLLDEMSSYQVYIKRLKKADPEAYRTYRRVGAFMLPAGMLSNSVDLEPGVLSRLPAFGAISFCYDHSTQIGSDGLPRVPIRFAWMTKLARPGHDVERRNYGTTYRCVHYADDIKDKKIGRRHAGVCLQYVIHVDDNGVVTPLRMLQSENQTIRHKVGVNRGTMTHISHQRWGLPEIAEDDDRTRADLLRTIFCLVMNFWSQAATQSMIRVTAEKGGIIMPFVVDILDTPGFFRDREATVDQSGFKKRIFHVVRTHLRASGGTVKMHFRGLRTFAWNGYQVRIVVPGRDAADLADLTHGAHEDVPEDEREGMLYFDETAETLIAAAIGAAPDHAAEELSA